MSDQPIEAEAVNETTALSTVTNPSPALSQNNKDAPPITAAQAKVEAIADLTHSAYQRAATLKLTPEETAVLQEDFPDEAFKPGAAGKENLIYLEHAFLRDRFSKVFGMGQWAIITRRTWSERFELPPTPNRREVVEVVKVYVEAMLVVRGCFVGEAIGDMDYYPKNMSQNYGDAVEGAKTAAFRRCAKEFGVGLQAWKKDWCQGWWDRKMAPGRRVHPPQNAPGRAADSPPPSGSPPPVKVAPAASQGANPVVEPAIKEVKHATDETRKWFCDRVKECREQATQFCIDLTWLMPNESLESIPLRFVPNTRPKLVEFLAKMLAWSSSGNVVPPYEADWDAEAKKKPEPKQEEEYNPTDEPWYGVVVPIPRKGMKRDEYMRNPDTIGSLYDARHDDEDARKRLWGLIKGGEECGWVPKAREFKGKIYQPSEADKKFYAALKQHKEWFDENHSDDKL